MNSELIECPACKHALRVPENLFGKTVRCPECKANFTAPTRDAEGNLGQPELLPTPLPPSPLVRGGGSPFFVPAMLLVLVSTIGTFVNGYQAMVWHFDRERAERAVGWLIEQYGNATRQEVPRDDLPRVYDIGLVLHHIAFGFSLLSLAGGLAVLAHRFRWLGILGSILAMINVSNCCCLLGLPAGGYCLIKLVDPEMKPFFARK